MDPQVVSAVDGAQSYAELFRIVKRLVERKLQRSRAGIMLGLSSLGVSPGGFLGGYFVVGSNAIILNRDVLNYVRTTEPRYHNAYAFHVLLHEYLHTLGWFREDEVRPLAHDVTLDALGPDHPATLIAAAMDTREHGNHAAPEFFRKLVYPKFGWAPAGRPDVEIVKGFDLDATPYIG